MVDQSEPLALWRKYLRGILIGIGTTVGLFISAYVATLIWNDLLGRVAKAAQEEVDAKLGEIEGQVSTIRGDQQSYISEQKEADRLREIRHQQDLERIEDKFDTILERLTE